MNNIKYLAILFTLHLSSVCNLISSVKCVLSNSKSRAPDVVVLNLICCDSDAVLKISLHIILIVPLSHLYFSASIALGIPCLYCSLISV